MEGALLRFGVLGPLRVDRDGQPVPFLDARIEIQRIEIQLELGRSDEAIPVLLQLTEAHPFREDLRAHLMLALYRTGRQSEALEAFRCTGKLLDEELGVAPGPGMQRLHNLILNASPELDLPGPKSAHVPRELPADTRGFVGRVEQIGLLDSFLDQSASVGVTAIVGTAGVGKTSLAIHWAHRVAERFPDGQLYLNLNGFSSTAPLRPIEALVAMLRSLDVPPEKVPVDEAAAAAMFRSMVAGRRLLVVLDNARSAAQVRPLIPGAAECLTVVTSRSKLNGLVAQEGAYRISLPVLTALEARSLIANALGDDRVAAEPLAADDLAQMCALLPLALRIAAANLTDQPRRTLAGHLAELRAGDRLASLEIDDDKEIAVRVAFDLSFQDIEQEMQSTFRLLGLVPGQDFTATAVGALTGLPEATVLHHLARLSNAHLIEQVGRDRYGFHDLLRLYAHERAIVESSETQRTDALKRLFAWYMHTVDSATELSHPIFLRLSPPGAIDKTTWKTLFSTPGEASGWLDEERRNLIAIIHRAADHGPPEVAWVLASGMRGYFAYRRHLAEWLPAADAAVRAASAHGDARSQSAAHLALAHAHQTRNDSGSAIAHLRLGAQRGGEAPWPVMQATCLGNLAGLLYDAGSVDEASDVLEKSLEINKAEGHLIGVAQGLGNLGLLKLRMGDLGEAVRALEDSVRMSRELPAELRALAISNLAEAYRQLGELGLAEDLVLEASAAVKQSGGLLASPLLVRARIFLDMQLYEDAGATAQAAQQAAVSVRHLLFEAQSLLILGQTEVVMGEHSAAIEHLEVARTMANKANGRFHGIEASIHVAAALSRAGDRGDAYSKALEALESTRKYRYEVLEGHALTLLSSVELDRGNLENGYAWAVAGLEKHRGTGCRLGEAGALILVGACRPGDELAGTWRLEGAHIADNVRESYRKRKSPSLSSGSSTTQPG